MTKHMEAREQHDLGAVLSETKEKVQEQLHQVIGQAKSGAETAADEAQTRVLSEVQKRAHQAGGPVGDAAESLRGVAGTLREKKVEEAAKIVDQAADRLTGIGEYLKSLGLDKAESVPQAKAAVPWWPFALAAVAFVGIVILRLARSGKSLR